MGFGGSNGGGGVNAPSLGMLGETELLPPNSDWFGQWPNGWLDESTGGNVPPRLYSDRASSTAGYDGQTVFESTNDVNLLQITSPSFEINPNKNYFFAMDVKTLSGTPSISVSLLCYSATGDVGASEYTLFTGYNPGGAYVRKGLRFYAYGGSAPAFGSGGCDRAIIKITLASNNNVKVGIKDVYFGKEELWHNDGLSYQSGGHEAYYDGANVFVSNFFGGSVYKMTTDGVNAGYFAAADPHEITGDGTYLYFAHWSGQVITKRSKPSGTALGSIATVGQPFSVCVYNGYLYCADTAEKLYQIRLSDFTLINTWTVSAMDNGTTEGTLCAVAGSLWLHTTAGGKVLRIDPSTGSVIVAIDAPAAFGGAILNYGFGTVGGRLYLSFHNGTLVEYDPATNTVSNSWNIAVSATSQIKNDGKRLWFVAQWPHPALVRFDPTTGVCHKLPMRRVGGGKWCEVVGDQVWCGGLDAARIQRFARF